MPINPDVATFHFNLETIMTGGDSRMMGWQKSLYGLLARNARQAKDYFNIPPSQIIEIGVPVQVSIPARFNNVRNRSRFNRMSDRQRALCRKG